MLLKNPNIKKTSTKAKVMQTSLSYILTDKSPKIPHTIPQSCLTSLCLLASPLSWKSRWLVFWKGLPPRLIEHTVCPNGGWGGGRGGVVCDRSRVHRPLPALCTCSSLLACSRMERMASSEPPSGVRIRVVMFPEERGRE